MGRNELMKKVFLIKSNKVTVQFPSFPFPSNKLSF